MNIKKYIEGLVSRGRYFFTLKEIEDNLNLSKGSIRVSLSRLKKAGEIASPAKGYYIIIPLEYRSLGCLPPDHFIPDLMKYLNLPYYVTLLSAGMYYGAAHQKPQTFQVMIPTVRKNLEIGKVRVDFHMNKYLSQSPVKKFNTPMSVLSVSSPEATALDLVTYPKASAGFSNILTVLKELVESMDLQEFRKVLDIKREIPVFQRLGYLMEVLQQEHYAQAVEQRLKSGNFEKAILDPFYPCRKGEVSKRWKLIINITMESDL